jgi:branched-chain amino acid transport system permease protein
MDGQYFGLFMYAIALLTMGGIFAVSCLGLNVQWGFTGLFNVGIAGFFAVGAYTSAILTASPSPSHLGGFDLPVAVGLAGSMLTAAVVAYAIGRICLRLQSDYLAIATIGIAEILRLVLKNEQWLTNGSLGVSNIPRPFESLSQPWAELAFLAVILGIVLVIYLAIERGLQAPWGRVMRAIRENPEAAEAAGKDVHAFRLRAFVFGSAFMGLGGALTAHSFKFISPEATEPLIVTFLVWVMLIVGGSGNNRGAVLGPMLIWGLWSMTELLTSGLPTEWAIRAAYLRIFLIGLVLQIVLQFFARGLLPERPPAIAAEGARTEKKTPPAT